MMSSHRSTPRRGALVLLAAGVAFAGAGAAHAQACSGVTLDPPVSGALDFGRLYVTSGISGTATLDPASGVVTASGRLVAAQAGVPLLVRVTDALPDCEFRLGVFPESQDLATAFTAVADRISMLEGTLLNSNPAQREWIVRMNNGVARILIGGVVEMNTSADGLIDDYVATFTVTVEPD